MKEVMQKHVAQIEKVKSALEVFSLPQSLSLNTVHGNAGPKALN